MPKSLSIPALTLLLTHILAADSIGVYLNQTDWQAAMSLNGNNVLTPIGFNSSQWTSRLIVQQGLTNEVSTSSQGITITSGYTAPGLVDNSTIGHIANGAFVDDISKYGATTLSFAQPIYGFGGDFAILGSNGLYLSPVGDVNSAFIGFISNQPISSFLISWGDLGGCLNCFGNSYTLTDLQVATLPTPEPHFAYPVGVLIAALTYRRYRNK